MITNLIILDQKPHLDERVTFYLDETKAICAAIQTATYVVEQLLGKEADVTSIEVKAVHTDRDEGEFMVTFTCEQGTVSAIVIDDDPNIRAWKS